MKDADVESSAMVTLVKDMEQYGIYPSLKVSTGLLKRQVAHFCDVGKYAEAAKALTNDGPPTECNMSWLQFRYYEVGVSNVAVKLLAGQIVTILQDFGSNKVVSVLQGFINAVVLSSFYASCTEKEGIDAISTLLACVVAKEAGNTCMSDSDLAKLGTALDHR
jgi:hypothetical protein